MPASKAFRNQGNAWAFDHGQWEFMSREFISAATMLYQAYKNGVKNSDYSVLSGLSVSIFNAALSIELIIKAICLKAQKIPKESIYSHNIRVMIEMSGGFGLEKEDLEFLDILQNIIEWAGRYPTPKWTKEEYKKKYDVPCNIVDDVEVIDASQPTFIHCASEQRFEKISTLYLSLRTIYLNLS